MSAYVYGKAEWWLVEAWRPICFPRGHAGTADVLHNGLHPEQPFCDCHYSALLDSNRLHNTTRTAAGYYVLTCIHPR